MSRDTKTEIVGEKTSDRRLGLIYEQLRELRVRGGISETNRHWCIVRAELERRLRNTGGFKTAKWTYSWNHFEDCLRRQKTFRLSSRAPKSAPMRIMKAPPGFETIESEWLGIAG